MDQDLEEISTRIKKIEDMVLENHTMLHRIQRRARMTMLISLIKWLVILGAFLGIFYYTKPYLEQTQNLYTQMTELANGLGDKKQQTESILDDFKSLFR